MANKDDFIDESKENYVEFLPKIKSAFKGRLAPKEDDKRFVRFEDRLDKTELNKKDLIRTAAGKYLMQWRELVLLKHPTDYAVIQLLLQELKPRTIIETGTFNGGSAVWMADMMKIHGIKSHVYSMDISHEYVDPLARNREDITLIQGDSNKIEEAFKPDFLKSLPHPWLVMEDSHVNIPGIMGHFDKFTQTGDYILVEDTNPEMNSRCGFGLLPEIEFSPVGKEWTMDPFKEFMKKHGSKYRVDTAYTDLFGYNYTCNCNSTLRKM